MAPPDPICRSDLARTGSQVLIFFTEHSTRFAERESSADKRGFVSLSLPKSESTTSVAGRKTRMTVLDLHFHVRSKERESNNF